MKAYRTVHCNVSCLVSSTWNENVHHLSCAGRLSLFCTAFTIQEFFSMIINLKIELTDKSVLNMDE